jgi:DNA polymerase alpha subunit B
LDINSCEETYFFPGQIVAVKGTKDSQKNVVKVSNCYNKVIYPDAHGTSQSQQTIVVAAGPFTTKDNLTFEPLDDLLHRAIVTESASLIVLIGPFLSSDHEMITNDEIDDTYDDIFDNIIKRINDRCRDTKTRVVLVPSLLDIQHDFVYPQPPFDVRTDKKHLVQSLSNPASFALDGIQIVASAHDVLNQLKNVEYYLEKKPHSQMELTQLRIGALFDQKSYYPLFSGEWDVPFDSSLSSMLNIDTLPDLLILPTDSEQVFALNIEGVLVINPKRLGTFDDDACLGGTYAKIVIQANTAASESHIQIKRV